MNIPRVTCACACDRWDLDKVQGEHMCIRCESTITTKEMRRRIGEILEREESEVA